MATPNTKAVLSARRKDDRLLAWLRLVRVVKQARSHVEGPMGRSDLTGPQLDVLVEVGLAAGLNQDECASRLGVTKGNIAQHVARLEGRGLIGRRPEGRSKVLFLTEEGHAVVKAVVPAHDDGVRSVLESLSRTEVRQLGKLLRKVERGLT